jgi:hypothetical protein
MDDREWHGYGEQQGPLAGRFTWSGPPLAMGERVTVVVKERALTAETNEKRAAALLQEMVRIDELARAAKGTVTLTLLVRAARALLQEAQAYLGERER